MDQHIVAYQHIAAYKQHVDYRDSTVIWNLNDFDWLYGV